MYLKFLCFLLGELGHEWLLDLFDCCCESPPMDSVGCFCRVFPTSSSIWPAPRFVVLATTRCLYLTIFLNASARTTPPKNGGPLPSAAGGTTGGGGKSVDMDEGGSVQLIDHAGGTPQPCTAGSGDLGLQPHLLSPLALTYLANCHAHPARCPDIAPLMGETW